MDFTGKVALITGAGNGIGRATALAFAGRGAKVVAVDKDGDSAERTAATIQQLGGDARSQAADVTKAAEGRLAAIVDMDEAVFDEVMGVNVKGVFLGLRHVLPAMLAQKSGAVVNTSSVAGLVGTPGMAAYVASKHAVIGLTKSAAGEVARSGVRVNAVCPGPIDTRMIHSIEAQINPSDPAAVEASYHKALPLGRYGTVDEIANIVLFLCSDLAGNINGAQFVADGGRTSIGGAITVLPKGSG